MQGTIETLSPTPPVSVEVAPGTMLGRFRVEARLGAGAMGVVYTARDEQLGRRVAVKLVKHPSSAPAARFLREAQVMAKLAHPNVAVIYDAGSADGRLFIAMELVEGETVAAWLERAHTPREVIALFVQAGRGLAAAHDAGIVHRDFKPANVLVGDGRARVVDFGLASDADDVPLAASGDREPAAGHALTQTGAVLGTPAYMAPEQRAGERATPASDQYSFCVALWEALTGARPNAERSEAPLRPMPRGVRRVLERGLVDDPAARWPSMAALLDVLERAGRGRRIATLAAIAGVIALGGATAIVFALRDVERPACGLARERLVGVWDPARKAAVHAAFSATKLPYAERAWQTVEQTVDRYADAWAKHSDDACRAAERGELSKPIAAIRQQCLDQRLDRLRLWADAFSRADARIVRDGVRAASELEDLAVCEDPDLRVEVRPSDPVLAAQVERLQRRVIAADLRATYEDYKKGVAELRELLVEARKLDYAPLVVETLSAIGHAEQTASDYKAALATTLEVRDLAEATHQDLLRARAWISLSFLYGSLYEYDKAHEAARVARAVLYELSGPAANHNRIAVDQSDAIAYWGDGKREVAFELLLEVDRNLRALHGDVFRLAGNEVNLGALLNELGRYDEAAAYFDRALQRYLQLHGDSHPAIASIINNQGTTFYFQGDYERAAERFREALAVRDRAGIPADNLGRGYNWLNLGESLVHLGRADDAIAAFATARPILGAKIGEDNTAFAELLTWSGIAKVARGDAVAAVPELERAIALYEKHKGEPGDIAEAELGLARALWEARPAERARARRLLGAARDHFATARKSSRQTEADQWLAKHE